MDHHETGEKSARERGGEAEALLQAGDYAGAVATWDRLIAAGLGDAVNYGRLGDALLGLQEFARAAVAYNTALERAPDVPELHINLARARFALGDADTAAAHLERVLRDYPDRLVLENLAVMAPGIPGYSPQRILEIRRALGIALANPDRHPADCLEEATAQPLGARPAPGRATARSAGGALRIAYLSAHFAQSAYMGPVWALINHHDRRSHQIFLLSDACVEGPFPGYGPRPEDTVVDVAAASDGELEQFLDQQRIDILVDLSGYSYRPRLSLFARRLSPAVATWFNMYATSGLPGIDYIIGDNHVVRPEEEGFYSETVLRLPQSYLTFQAFEGRPPVAPAPCAGGAPLTFGSLVSAYKITEPVVAAWADILKRAPDCRLLLANADLGFIHNKQWLLARFARHGAPLARILLRGPAPHDEFLRYYDGIDVALDSFPYSGGTTTMEALWQGVPVLTQAGDGWAARTTGSILVSAGLSEFCRRDAVDYVDAAVALATAPDTPARLAELRQRMRDDLQRRPALDGASLARGMEGLFEGMRRPAGTQ